MTQKSSRQATFNNVRVNLPIERQNRNIPKGGLGNISSHSTLSFVLSPHLSEHIRNFPQCCVRFRNGLYATSPDQQHFLDLHKRLARLREARRVKPIVIDAACRAASIPYRRVYPFRFSFIDECRSDLSKNIIYI